MIRRQFIPAGDDATMHGGLVGEPRRFRAAVGSLEHVGYGEGVSLMPARGLNISQKPGISPKL